MLRISKFLCLAMAAVLCLSLVGCGGGSESEPESSVPVSSEVSSLPPEEPKIVYEINPLTGLETLTKDEVGLRPVAVSVSNIRTAQPIQSGVGYADVVYETVTEGGITRLLAIYKNPTDAIEHIGSIRSARVVFAELAASHKAVLVHHGMDERYCRPRVNELSLPRIEVSQKYYGDRINNGKAWEHRLYTSGKQLKEAIAKKDYAEGYESDPWLNFSAERTPSTLAATNVTVRFNGSYITNFFYNAETKGYIRGSKGEVMTDYFAKTDESFTNVFVLFTATKLYPDEVHTEVKLAGGDGYYITQGGYEKITWSKKGSSTPISFKDENGAELTVTPGNSYICLVDKYQSNTFTVE